MDNAINQDLERWAQGAPEAIRDFANSIPGIQYLDVRSILRKSADLIEMLQADRDHWQRRAEAAEPRLLTLREVQCYQACPVLWLEHENGSPNNGRWMDTNFVINERAHPDRSYSKKYGIGWRCWTWRPSPEQSMSTPWEGPRDESKVVAQ